MAAVDETAPLLPTKALVVELTGISHWVTGLVEER